MRNFLTVFNILAKVVSSMIYMGQGPMVIPTKWVIYKEEAVASMLSCVHLCLRLQSDAFYVESTCKCLRVGDSNVAEDGYQSMDRNYMKSVGKN